MQAMRTGYPNTISQLKNPYPQRGDKANPRSNGGAPLGFEAGDANIYRYVKNNSLNLLDPSGLAPLNEDQWPSWLLALRGREGVTGGRGIIRTIISVNQEHSHALGADGAGVPAHYDVRYIDEAGGRRFQKFLRDARPDGSRAFTDEEHAAVTQNRNTERERARDRRDQAAQRRRRDDNRLIGAPPSRTTIVQNLGTLSLPVVPVIIGMFRAGDGNPMTGYNNLTTIEIANRANLPLQTADSIRRQYGLSGMLGLIGDLAAMNHSELTPTPPLVIRQQIQYGLNPDISEAINNFFGFANYREVTVHNPPNLINPTYVSVQINQTVWDRLVNLELNWEDIETSLSSRTNGASDIQRSRAMASVDLIREAFRRQHHDGPDTGSTSVGGDY